MNNWQSFPCKPYEGHLNDKGYGRKWDPAVKKNRLAHRMRRRR